ncbi:MAG: PH domain-containing protein [Planctomycetota bacterium]
MRNYCLQCGEALVESGAFCHKCGARKSESLSGSAPLRAATAGVANIEKAAETDLWRGRPSGKAFAHYWLVSILFAIVMIIIGWKFETLTTPALIVAPIPIIYTLGIIAIAKLSTRYRLSTERIFVETGILNRKLKETELVRIDDVSVQQNLLQRMFGVGVVALAAHDADTGTIYLNGITNPMEVKELVRAQVRKHQQNVLKTHAV